MSERRDQDPSPPDDRHIYGRRAYDHGPPAGTEDRRAPTAPGQSNGQPDGAPKGNGQPVVETHALQKSEPRALQKIEPPEPDQRRETQPDQPRPSEPNQRRPAEPNQSRAPEPPDVRGDHQRPQQPEQPRPEAAQKHQPPKPNIRPGLPRLLLIGLIVALIVAGVAAALMFWLHHRRLAKEADRRSQEVDRGPKISVTTVRAEPGTRELTLPADVRGFSQATVYAKVTGYVKSIFVDKGDVVKRGQLLGILESPEVDQQVAGAVADLAVKKRTFERYRHLVAKDFVSQQDFDTARAQYEVAEAAVKQARALQDYEKLRAPFAGTVTARYVDPGALVPAAAGSTQGALPLVDIADLDRLRILLFVQQDAASFIRAGDIAEISVDERPDLQIKAPITRVSGALDPRSRTMLCEIWLENEHRLYPGTFVHITLHLKIPAYPIVPSSALIIHDNKSSLAVIRDDQVHFVPVKPGLDDGHNVQIKEGAQVGETIALDLPAELAEGAQVQPEQKKDPEDKGGAHAGGQNQGGQGNEKSKAQGHDEGDKKNEGDKKDKGGDGKQAAKGAGDKPAKGTAPNGKPGKPKSPADKGSGKLSDDPMAGGSQ